MEAVAIFYLISVVIALIIDSNATSKKNKARTHNNDE